MEPLTSPHYLPVIPFIGLLLMIATGPVLYPHFWHRYYVPIAISLGAVVVGHYVFILGNYDAPVEALAEYIQFILLIAALYMVSGSILIKLQYAPTPRANLGVLWTGAVLANFIGTTGASMLLIRPYIRLNKKRLSAYHIVFFIFMVSNVGGVCTPVADPPLFLGFLKGVPFFFTLRYGILPFLFALSLLSMIFYWIDRNNKVQGKRLNISKQSGITIKGLRNFLLFIVILGAVFLDPHTLKGIPSIPYKDMKGHVHHFSFIRELIFIGVILYVYFTADKEVLRANSFTLEPLKEVVFIFIGIFFTMMPALSLIEEMAETHKDSINTNLLYWATGILSSVLDNAPTYLNFLTAGMAAKGLDVNKTADVIRYAAAHASWLSTTSIAAVFFGAMTYVGNGPNFMVRAIAEEQGQKMPSFGGYIWRYSIRFLLPVLCLVWLIFT